jgi:hypothetical protein
MIGKEIVMNVERLEKLLVIANSLGDIERANMYDKDNIYVEGKTKEGKKFNISLTITTEGNENA